MELASRARAFAPEAVLFVRDGGAVVGEAFAAALGVPAVGLDARYAGRRWIDRLPPGPRAALWPVKELAYRLGRPRLTAGALDLLPRFHRAALVDDSASTGRTLAAVLASLASRGIPRSALFVAVVRCGDGAKRLVDAYVTDSRVRIRRDPGRPAEPRRRPRAGSR